MSAMRRRDDNTKALHAHGGQLVAKGLASPRGQNCECIFLIHHPLDDLTLSRPECIMPEVAPEHLTCLQYTHSGRWDTISHAS